MERTLFLRKTGSFRSRVELRLLLSDMPKKINLFLFKGMSNNSQSLLGQCGTLARSLLALALHTARHTPWEVTAFYSILMQHNNTIITERVPPHSRSPS